MDSTSNRPPDRWLECPAFGEIIDDTFLPMKTLLNEEVPLPPDYRFTPEIFMKQMRDRKINIGLVINLTFSRRYYDGDEFMDDHDIEYKQITCRGHNEAPQEKERIEFIKTCNSFLNKNPTKKIAVHCTHGFNRTGFMICSFLCCERDWAIDAAISQFSNKRPPGIYKQDYINELFNLFGDSDDPITEAPPKPLWDSDEGLMIDLHGEPQIGGSGVVQREFYEGITEVHLIRDEALKQRIYRHCCMLCNYNVNSSSISFPGAQPVSMDLTNLELLKVHRYRVSWKADGCRYMLYIQDEDNIFFLTRSLQLWRVSGLKFPKKEDLNSHITDTLLDGEMVTDIINNDHIPKYLIYDVISYNGNIVANQNFDQRCGLIKCVIVEARRRARHANLISPEGEPFKVADKGFFYIQDAKKTWDLKVTHEKDGLIFQPVSAPYVGGTCHNILKWKPPHLNSIDFRLVVREERQNGCLPETFAYLHVSNRAEAIIKFRLDKDQASYQKYNNKIVEMTLGSNSKWIIMRERTDKLTANSYETASSTFKSIKHPVTEKKLFDCVASIPPESRSKI